MRCLGQDKQLVRGEADVRFSVPYFMLKQVPKQDKIQSIKGLKSLNGIILVWHPHCSCMLLPFYFIITKWEYLETVRIPTKELGLYVDTWLYKPIGLGPFPKWQ
jgi:hypothetical protein